MNNPTSESWKRSTWVSLAWIAFPILCLSIMAFMFYFWGQQNNVNFIDWSAVFPILLLMLILIGWEVWKAVRSLAKRAAVMRRDPMADEEYVTQCQLLLGHRVQSETACTTRYIVEEALGFTHGMLYSDTELTQFGMFAHHDYMPALVEQFQISDEQTELFPLRLGRLVDLVVWIEKVHHNT